MAKRDRTPSEFEGGGVMPNTVFPKGAEALNAHDRLRLQSLTGQEEDSRAPVDPYHWYGNVAPEPVIPDTTKADEIRRAERERYRETR